MKSLLSLLFTLFTFSCFADVVSSTGKIEFKLGLHEDAKMTLTDRGLGIGTSPSANLHVNGNLNVSDSLKVSIANVSSQLNVEGAIGFQAELVGSNITLGVNTMILAGSSSDNLVLTLPLASEAERRLYKIKKIHPSHWVQIKTSGDDLIDGQNFAVLMKATDHVDFLPHVDLISSGGNWHVIRVLNCETLLWSPSRSDVLAWYDASLVSSDVSASAVSRWEDLSENGLDVQQLDVAKQPSTGANTLNGLNVLSFGENSYLKLDPFTLPVSGNFSIYMVFKVEATPSAYSSIVSFDDDNVEPKDFQYCAANMQEFNGQLRSFGIGLAVSNVGNFNTFGGFHLHSIQFDLSASTAKTFVDGILALNLSGYSSGFPNQLSFHINSNRAEDQPISSQIAEVILTEDVTSNNQETIEGYLAWKWGLQSQLDSSHTYFSAAP